MRAITMPGNIPIKTPKMMGVIDRWMCGPVTHAMMQIVNTKPAGKSRFMVNLILLQQLRRLKRRQAENRLTVQRASSLL